MIYFAGKNTSALKLGKFHWDGKALFSSCTNGSSELVSSISMSVVAILYNYQLMKFAGENGVVSAAISFLRTLLFQIASVLILPLLFGLNGIWYSLFVAEILATAVTLTFYVLKRNQYHYC